MKIVKVLILVVIYTPQLIMTLEPALAKSDVSSTIAGPISNENLQLTNNGFQSKKIKTIDLFPEQSWSSLRVDMSNTVVHIPSPPVEPVEVLQLPPPLPFTVVGEWLEKNQQEVDPV